VTDELDPLQYLQSVSVDRDNSTDIPEKSLLLALVALGILGIRVGRKLHRRNDYRWVFSARRDPWSFEWACEMLGLCPDDLRSRVEAWLRQPYKRAVASEILRWQ
jgi:hypothetical protein